MIEAWAVNLKAVSIFRGFSQLDTSGNGNLLNYRDLHCTVGNTSFNVDASWNRLVQYTTYKAEEVAPLRQDYWNRPEESFMRMNIFISIKTLRILFPVS